MINRGSFPFLKRAMDASDSLRDELRHVADTHNSAMRTLLEQALKAQAELYKGQLAVVENLIGKLHKPSSPPPATHARPAAAAPPAPVSPASPTPTAAATISPVQTSRAQAIATATAAATESAALAQQIRPTISGATELRTAMPSRPTPFPSKDS
ncbi:hypothetical protein SSBR45G_11570 [Bradyrhizobium sp. SSBR45G]|uniref:hypothetical protein n=1 Tax=unclassified Bradyrhizobium TaxID=2631580 RepID=UPI002342BA4F|nr:MULTISPECIES: hypothetical protein [unclassified Bradyrhizobium]GLH76249.1 hypothetical protein SSBR45G_11570 [Bradyrhizobium sp. SSBR45G]GLH83268.1 hypothetical protein SSBR45R_07280 [Bradyrhizobium sp. SSBR45R]